MSSKILVVYETIVKPTITLASLGNGAGRIASVVDNTSTRASTAAVYLQIKTGGSAPTANAPVKLYNINRSNDGTNDIPDGETSAQALGTSDAAVSVEPTNAECIGSLAVDTSTAKTWKMRRVAFDLGPKYSPLVWNAIGQALDGTGGSFDLQVQPMTPEGQ